MIHTVVLNSNNALSTPKTVDNPQNNGNSVNYSMDWGFLKENTQYKIRSYFNSTSGNFNADTLVIASADFLGSSTCYEPAGLRYGRVKSDYLTMIHAESVSNGSATGVHLQTHSIDSGYIMLQSKPLNNVFNITLKLTNNTLLTCPVGFSYVLVLEFIEVDNSKY